MIPFWAILAALPLLSAANPAVAATPAPCVFSTPAAAVVEDVLGPDSQAAAKALKSLILDEELLLQTAVTILEGLASAPEEIGSIERDDTLPLWVTLQNAGGLTGTRIRDVTGWICNALREANPSERRDAVRSRVMQLLETRYARKRDPEVLRNITQLFFFSKQIRPSSDCREVLAFVKRVVDASNSNGQELSEREQGQLASLVYSYVAYKGKPGDMEKCLEEYPTLFDDPDLVTWLQSIPRRHPEAVSESDYRLLLKKTPEELAASVARVSFFTNSRDLLICSMLTCTRKLRRDNFELLLPLIKQGDFGKCDSFLTAYCQAVPADAPASEQAQQNVILDILEDRIKNQGQDLAVHGVRRLIFADPLEESNAINNCVTGRALEILEWCASSNRDYLRTEAAYILRKTKAALAGDNGAAGDEL